MKKIILPLLLLSVLLTACQTAPADTHFTTAPSATAPATKPATQPTTEPTTTGQHSTSNTINNAKKITVGMTEADVFAILQLSGQTLFQNVSVQRWDLDNGKFLYVWFHPTEASTNTDLSQLPFSPDGTYLCGGFEVCDQRQSWPGDYTPSAEDVALLQEGMPQEEVFAILGIGGKDIGCGSIIYKWLMNDGNQVTMCLNGGIASSILVSPANNNDDLSDSELVNNLSVGMTYYDIGEFMTYHRIPVCTNAEIVQYPLKNGGYALIWYAEIDGVRTVCKTEVQGGALA